MKELRASVDIGSNSVLLLIAEVSSNSMREVSRRQFITSLGRELDVNKVFHPESMAATMDALRAYAEECDGHQIPREKIIVTATEASRVARNAREFFAKVEKELGLKVQVITSAGEAHYSARGILFDTQFDSEIITIMDIGGASTELIRVNTRSLQIIESISMPVGSVRCSQWLKDGLFVQNLQKIFLDFRMDLDRFQTRELYCVAGTITSLGNMHLERRDFQEDDVHGLKMRVEDVDALFKSYAEGTPEELLEKFPFLQKRAQSIRGGLHLVYHLAHRLMVKDLVVSTYGLRYGTLLDGSIRKEFLHEQ
jgi:exopolyphosphatase/guanosine-5'-triphosphate,3'-diphosphate pyrophosphatase